MLNTERRVRYVAAVCLLVISAGCATKKAFTIGEREMRRENYDAAVLAFSKAVALDPGNSRYSLALERAKLKSAAEHFDKGRRFLESMQYEEAIAEFQQTLLLTPDFQHASNEMARALRELRRRQTLPSEMEALKERARRRDLGPPLLHPQTNIPILLKFTDAEVGKIFEAIGKASGINFIFDEKTDLDKPMTIDIGNVALEKALDILMLQTKNFYKPIDEYTLLVAPDSRQKRQEYDDQVIRTFFLSNADTKQVVTLLRSLLQSRQIAENPDLNSVTIKDTPDKVAIAERIINANDKSKGEVLIDVELLEIDRNVMETLGIDLTSKTLLLQFNEGNASVPLNNLDVLKQSGNWSIGPIPSVTLDFLKSDTSAKLLAKPQLRVSEGEQAELLIGDRIPIPTTSFNTSNTVGSSVVPITNFTYQNVGITVQFEPRVHHNKEVTLKVQVEISQVTGSVDNPGSPAQPIIGTRQIQTVIRLRDGETNMLAGLIQRENRDTLSGLPGVSDIPGVRRLLSKSTLETRETDIILTLTPRIIRIPDITEDDLATLWVGTEDNMRLKGPARNALHAGPFASNGDGGIAGAGSAIPGDGSEPSGGSITRISPSDEVERDRAEAQREQESADRRAAAAEAAGAAEGDPITGEPEGGPVIVPPGVDDPGDSGDPAGVDDRSGNRGDDSSGTAIIRLIPSSSAFSVGDTVVVEVVVDNASNAGSIPFHLKYNPAVLQFLSGATVEGNFMKSDGTNTVFLASDLSGGGEIVVGLSRMGGGEGMSGSGSLATFQFQAIGAGNCGFQFTSALVKDPQARNLSASFNTVAVQVQP